MIHQGTSIPPSDNPLLAANVRIKNDSAFLDNSCPVPKRGSCLLIRNSTVAAPVMAQDAVRGRGCF